MSNLLGLGTFLVGGGGGGGGVTVNDSRLCVTVGGGEGVTAAFCFFRGSSSLSFLAGRFIVTKGAKLFWGFDNPSFGRSLSFLARCFVVAKVVRKFSFLARCFVVAKVVRKFDNPSFGRSLSFLARCFVVA